MNLTVRDTWGLTPTHDRGLAFTAKTVEIFRRSRHHACRKPPTPAVMTAPVAVHGHEIINLVSSHPDGIRLSQLAETVMKRFGSSATFHTCSALGMNLDALLAFLEARDKVRISNGVVHVGHAPVCAH